jgi:hypothetical protein
MNIADQRNVMLILAMLALIISIFNGNQFLGIACLLFGVGVAKLINHRPMPLRRTQAVIGAASLIIIVLITVNALSLWDRR